ncbi:MAG: rhomboid family intramembrane serine protease [Flexistipes sp.]|nr:rhomboid family intramembrane serine protease [Flexistipes sp.]
MFPISDSIKALRKPYINTFLIIFNIAIFFYQLSLGSEMRYFIFEYGLIPLKVFAPFEIVPAIEKIYPFFTSMFLHGGWFHLISNMYFLFIFGDNVEDDLGHVKYLFVYIMFGLAAAITQVIMFSNSGIPTIGASGAVAGVMGYYFIRYPHATVKTLVIFIFFITIVDIPAIIFLGVWFFIQFISGSTQAAVASGGGIAWWAHIGGFFSGILICIINRKRYYRAG